MTEKLDPRVHPWKKGFRPPAKCPVCAGVNTLEYTGERTGAADHVYFCHRCSKTVGAPTTYAWCNRDNEVLEKDIFYTPCIRCVNMTPLEGSPQCKWWQAAQSGEVDDRYERSIEESMGVFREAERKYQDAMAEPFTAAGAETSLYEKLRKQRLKELEEGEREE